MNLNELTDYINPSLSVVEYNDFINIKYVDPEGTEVYFLTEAQITRIVDFRDNVFFPFVLAMFIIMMIVSILGDFSK